MTIGFQYNCSILEYWRDRFLCLVKTFCVTNTYDKRSVQELQRLFAQVSDNYDNLIERICFGYANSVEELQDLKQDAMLNIWMSLPKFKGESGLKTWIYRVTFNSCVTATRQKNRRPNTVKLTELYDTIDYDEERKQLLTELHETISLLNPLDKSVIMLWLDNVDYKEIAMITGLSKSNVAVRIHRAKDKLANLLNPNL